MGTAFGDFGKLIDAFMAAAIDLSRWDAAMDVAAEATGSFGALMQPLRARMASVPVSKSIRPLMEPYVQEGWVERDERYRSVPALMRRGSACDLDYTTVEEMAHSPFYQDGLIRHGLQWYGGVRVGETGDLWGLALQRTPAQGPFLSAELARLAILSHSLAGAAELAQAFGFARMEAALAAFETSGSPVAAVDRYGAVVRLNASANGFSGRTSRLSGGASRPSTTRRPPRSTGRSKASMGAGAGSASPGCRPAPAGRSPDPGLRVALFRRGSRRFLGVLGFRRVRRSRRPPPMLRVRPRAGLRPHPRGDATGERASARSLAGGRRGASRRVARNRAQPASGRLPKTDTHGQGQLVGLLARLAKANAY